MLVTDYDEIFERFDLRTYMVEVGNVLLVVILMYLYWVEVVLGI